MIPNLQHQSHSVYNNYISLKIYTYIIQADCYYMIITTTGYKRKWQT